MANKCRVCAHENLHQINRALVTRWRTRDGFRKISARYGLTISSLYRHFVEHLPRELVRSEEAERTLRAESLMEHLTRNYARLEKLLEACEDVLRDPDDPSRWAVGSQPETVAQARAEDLTVFYSERVGEKVINKKSRLDVLLQAVESKGRKVSAWIFRAEDVRKTARETALAIKAYLELAAKLTGLLKADRLELDLGRVIGKIVEALRPYPEPLRRVVEALRLAEAPLPSAN